ncbi:MAG TPA: hypothetical protein VLT33_17360 [Labilithrix sp.]|nr:hypothetical protein [Labilithrix sp.]
MWPFGEETKEARRLAAIPPGETGAVAVQMTVVSENVVISPLSGLASAFLQIDLLERLPMGQASGPAETLDDDCFVLGSAKHGDILRLRDDDGDEIRLVASRVRFEVSTGTAGQPIADIPVALAPFLKNATGRGILCAHEHALRKGDSVLLRAVVEPSLRVVPDGYRSGTKVTYVARDDLAPVVLVEVVDVPAW